MKPATWTGPSVLSASRIPIAGLVVWLILDGDQSYRWWAAAALLAGVATDFLDGYLARRFHSVTEFGKVIDPLADKIGVGMVFVALTITGDLELWVVGVVVLRDLLLLAGALYIRKKKGITVQSNWPGKVAVTAMAVLALVSLLRLEELDLFRTLTLWFTMFMIVFSLVLYAQRLFIGRPREAASD